MPDKNIHKENVEPLIKNEEKVDEKIAKHNVFPIKTPETDSIENTAKESSGLNQEETRKNTPPLT
ncbi:MAG: hypothetical protein ABIP68_04410 [Ferruginibacter sp.]